MYPYSRFKTLHLEHLGYITSHMHNKQTQNVNFELSDRDFPDFCPQSFYDKSLIKKVNSNTCVRETNGNVQKVLMIAYYLHICMHNKHTENVLFGRIFLIVFLNAFRISFLHFC